MEGLGELVGCGVDVCPPEHAKRRNAKVGTSRDILAFHILKGVLMSLLLTKGSLDVLNLLILF